MAKKKSTKPTNVPVGPSLTTSSVDELLMAALERGGDTLETGRYLVTFKENSGEEGLSSLGSVHGMRVADARDRQSGGSGIGLAITDRSVGLHNGSVTALNEPGGGLLVEIRLPVTDMPD